jgi:hypothetical protein
VKTESGGGGVRSRRPAQALVGLIQGLVELVREALANDAGPGGMQDGTRIPVSLSREQVDQLVEVAEELTSREEPPR